ncbi:MAG: ABC transporter permease, partial [Gemmatimonadales bacterium]
LLRSPGYAAVAILSLALGIGANTAIFSLTDAVILRSLPVRHPEELVAISIGERGNSTFTNPIWEQVRDGTIPLAGTAAYSAREFNLARGGVARKVGGSWVSGSYFPMMGIKTVAGHLFGPSDDVRGCVGTAVVSEGFADREYGSPAAAIGKGLSVDGHPVTIVGVSDGAFTGVEVGQETSVYLPLCQVDAFDGPGTLDVRARWYLNIVGRLKAGMPIAQVQSWLATNSRGMFEATVPPQWRASDQADYLANKLGVQYAAAGLSDLRDSYATALWVLMAVVGIVLIIACANVANLMLARAAAREREIAIRLAIGAGRGRLIRQFLTESVLVTFIGAGLGMLFARWATALLVRLLSLGADQLWLDIGLDGRVLAFTAALAVVTGLVFGMVPAWRGTGVDPHAAMKAGGRSATGSERRHRLGRMLVVGQVALSLALVAGAGLLVGSFRRLVTLDPGFKRQGVLLVSADFGNSGFDRARRGAVTADLLRRIREVPGVSSASVSAMTPIGGFFWNGFVEVPGFTPKSERDALADFNKGSDGYFATLQTPILEGRDFGPQDAATSPLVAIINQAMATKFFGTADPLGRQFRLQEGSGTGPWITVVGITANARYASLDKDPEPQAYYPMTQGFDLGPEVVFEVRGPADSRRSPAATLSQIKDLLLAASPAVSITFKTFDAQISASLARPRLLATLSGFFGALALLLAVIGIYGVISY